MGMNEKLKAFDYCGGGGTIRRDPVLLQRLQMSTNAVLSDKGRHCGDCSEWLEALKYVNSKQLPIACTTIRYYSSWWCDVCEWRVCVAHEWVSGAIWAQPSANPTVNAYSTATKIQRQTTTNRQWEWPTFMNNKHQLHSVRYAHINIVSFFFCWFAVKYFRVVEVAHRYTKQFVHYVLVEFVALLRSRSKQKSAFCFAKLYFNI